MSLKFKLNYLVEFEELVVEVWLAVVLEGSPHHLRLVQLQLGIQAVVEQRPMGTGAAVEVGTQAVGPSPVVGGNLLLGDKLPEYLLEHLGTEAVPMSLQAVPTEGPFGPHLGVSAEPRPMGTGVLQDVPRDPEVQGPTQNFPISEVRDRSQTFGSPTTGSGLQRSNSSGLIGPGWLVVPRPCAARSRCNSVPEWLDQPHFRQRTCRSLWNHKPKQGFA